MSSDVRETLPRAGGDCDCGCAAKTTESTCTCGCSCCGAETQSA